MTTTVTMTGRDLTREQKVTAIQDFLARRQTTNRPVPDRALRVLTNVLDLHGRQQLDERILDKALAVLDLLEYTGSDTASAEHALQPVVTHAVTLDGQRTDVLDADQLKVISKAARQYDSETALIFQYMVEDGGFTLSSEELVATLQEISKQYRNLLAEQPVSGDERVVAIARRWRADDGEPAKLEKILPDSSRVTSVPGPHARAIRTFLERHPQFLSNLQGRVLGFKFLTGEAKQYGGGVFKDGYIQMADLSSLPARAFLRLVVHETGHASFQRILLDGEKLPEVLTKGAFVHCVARRQSLRAALDAFEETAREAPDRSLMTGSQRTVAAQEELATAERQIAQARSAWANLSEDAKDFYRAWNVLRKDGAAYLLGLDLGPTRRPDARRSYQAGDFTEFCAETFMQLATGELYSHVAIVQASDDIPADVKDAWRTALRILQKHGTPVLDGTT